MADSRDIVISGAAGAWGDSSLSTGQLLEDGRSQYIIYEGLAEITMAILSRAKAQDPGQGYARDLIETIAANVEGYRAGGIRVVTNAGGVNPRAAAEVIAGAGARVAIVEGDDLSGRMGELEAIAADSTSSPMSVNAYLGARPIAAALDAGAEVVVTGRVVDSALALGPLIHEFGWGFDDFDLLSAGSLVGHLLECGPQSTGGLLTDWEDTPSWVNPGFPIAEVGRDGSFVVTAPEHSDALVDVRTVAEQLLYEIGDPAAYVLPDVVCDWSNVALRQVAHNRVSVSGAVGRAPTPTLKACAQVADGWRAQFLLFIGGRDAAAKARRVGTDLLERGRRMLESTGAGVFRATSIEVLGAEDTYGAASRAGATREVVLKIGVHHDSREAVARFIREVPSIALSGAPGLSGGGTGLPRPAPLIRLDCFPVPREAVVPTVSLDGAVVPFVDVPHDLCEDLHPSPAEEAASPVQVSGVSLPLVCIAHGRSGDKGADVNIGIRARHPDFWRLVLDQVTAEAVGAQLAHLGAVRIRRFSLPGITAVNLLLTGGLGAGGTASLRFDPQGKAVAQQLLDMEIRLPAGMIDHPELREVPELLSARAGLK